MIRVFKYWLPVVLWMGVISFMSTDVGSAMHTSRILEPLMRWMKPSATPEDFALVHLLVRKAAHLSEYAVLSLLVFRALRSSQPVGGRRRSTWTVALTALIIACAYSATDEFHQSFVPGRTAAVGDVMIDCCGAALGLSLIGLRSVTTSLRDDKSPVSPTAPQI